MNQFFDQNSTEKRLLESVTWPQKVRGTLEVIDGGDQLETGFASWLSCVLRLDHSEDDLSVMIYASVLEESKITEDDLEGKDFDVWVTAPEKSADLLIFGCSKIRGV